MISPILSVKDIDASVKFYTEKLGFEHSFSLPDDNGVNSFAFVNIGKSIHIGFNRDAENAGKGNGVDFMIYVDDDTDIDAFYAEIKGRDVMVLEEIADRYWGDRTFALHDPDQYRLTFAKTTKQFSLEEIKEIEAEMRGDKSPT